jgi:hypothetical protein
VVKLSLCVLVVKELPRVAAVDGGVDAAEGGNAVILDQLFAGNGVGTEFLGKRVADTKGKAHDIGLFLMPFNLKSLFQAGFQLENISIGMASQLIGRGNSLLSHFPVMGEQGRLEILVVEVFNLVVDADFDDTVLIVAIRSEAVGEVQFIFIEFDAMTGFIVEVFEFRFSGGASRVALEVLLGEIVSGYPFIPFIDNLAQDFLYACIDLFYFALGLHHILSLKVQAILNQVGRRGNRQVGTGKDDVQSGLY